MDEVDAECDKEIEADLSPFSSSTTGPGNLNARPSYAHDQPVSHPRPHEARRGASRPRPHEARRIEEHPRTPPRLQPSKSDGARGRK